MDRSADNLGQIINDIERELEELKTTQLRVREVLYPVGSIYMSATLTTPQEVAAIFGGTWEAWGSGRVPVGVNSEDTDFSTVEATGGEKTHTLTTGEMPSHNHELRIASSGGSITHNYAIDYVGSTTQGWADSYMCYESGGGGAHNNLQPYITCYMYKRVQ